MTLSAREHQAVKRATMRARNRAARARRAAQRREGATMTPHSPPFTPIPPGRQPPWLRQLRQVIRVYPADPATGYGAALCRWCDLAWPLPLAELEADPAARDAWRTGVAAHGIEHFVAGDVRLDDAGEPVDDHEDDDDREEDGVGWHN